MKRILRAVLTDNQFRLLSRGKATVSAGLNHCFSLILNRLPVRVLLFVRTNIDIVRKMDYPKHDILLQIDSAIEYNTRRHSCRKEPETVEWIETYFQPGDVFFDVGANVGAYSLIASKYLGGQIKVYAAEPGFANYRQLCRNILLNNCQDSIVPLPVALSNRTSLATFNYNNLAPGGALHALGPPIDYKGDPFNPVGQLSVLAYRLDDLITQYHLPAPNHLKIDVDGTEFQVLTGAEQTLGNPSVRSVILELEETREDTIEINQMLHQKGFVFKSKHQQQENVYNYIFLRNPDA